MFVLKFENPEFAEEKLNCTVRLGYPKQDLLIGRKVSLQNNKGEEVKQGIISYYLVKPFWAVENKDLEVEHDLDCRTYTGLYSAMRKYYGKHFDNSRIVTLVYFTIMSGD